MSDRKKNREEFAKRGTHQAHQRLKILVELGKDKDGNTDDDYQNEAMGRVTTANDETFGMDDDDWNVYRDIQKDRFSEDEEDDQQALCEAEEKIADLDTDFGIMLYHSGPGGHRPPSAEDFQLRLWTDRYRGAEVLFQPTIIGSECAGLTEALEMQLSQYTQDQKQRLLSNLVILGGNTLVPGMD